MKPRTCLETNLDSESQGQGLKSQGRGDLLLQGQRHNWHHM